MQTKGLHAHGNFTAPGGALTDTHPGATTGPSQSTVDTRPLYVGLLYIMKVW
jgi:hypothetical protein